MSTKLSDKQHVLLLIVIVLHAVQHESCWKNMQTKFLKGEIIYFSKKE